MPGSLSLLLLATGLAVFLPPWPGPGAVKASESPERECCDPIYPLLTPTATTIINPTSLATTSPGYPGPNVKNTVAILNCLLAKQLCQDDASCSAIQQIIPKVCGIEQVACSTTTVIKCQAALRTLQGFQFFRPTCLCREPSLDPECNQFRDSLFDHPCIYVLKKDNDPYPVQALPTCNHALSVCQLEQNCIKLFEDFKLHCKVRDGVCKMESRDMCMEAWKSLRSTPMLGCICPNNPMKRRCDRIFNVVHNNPCIAEEIYKRKMTVGDVQPHPGRRTRHIPRTGTTYTSIMPRSQAHRVNSIALGTHSQSQHQNQISAQTKSGSDEELEKRGFTEDHPAMTRKPPGLTSTCHFVLNGCQKDRDCRSALLPVLRHCDKTNCHQVSCREALHNLYENISVEWRLEIAYCLCRRSDNPNDECLVAQEKLHPGCAQRVDGPTPACHSIALACNEDRDCRSRLETFEQACAVDSLTKKCAGSTHDCRLGLVRILGTELRDICDCKGTDFAQLYECLGWQRLLWFNPCVVQSQLDYYNKRSEILSAEMLRYGNVVPDAAIPYRRNFSKVIQASDLGFTQNFLPALINNRESNTIKETTRIHTPVMEFLPKKTERTTAKTTPTTTTTTTTTSPFLATTKTTAATTKTTTMATTTTTTITTTTTSTTTTTMTTPTTTTTTTTTTTRAPPTTTLPPKYCLVERENQATQFIAEGNAKRLYKDDEPECSEVCHCQLGEHLECRTICVKRAACKSEFAFYNHAAPAYQAYRGRCICYSGRFICVRPHPGHYTIPHGIFMFLGYSETDEALLKPHNNLSVIDMASTLQQLLTQIHNRTICTLEIFNITKENLIMVAHIIRPTNVTLRYSDLAALGKECSDQLQDLSDRINSRDLEVHSHLLLSILKLAEVEVRIPEMPEEDFSTTLTPLRPLILGSLGFTFYFLTFS